MLALMAAVSLAVTPSATEMLGAWQQFAKRAAGHLCIPLPEVPEADWQALSRGEILTRRFRPADSPIHRVLAMRFIDQAPASMWLAILDGRHADLPKEITNWEFPGATGVEKELYTRLDLPFPLSNRHWILIARSNADLYRATAAAAWERCWDLDPRGEAALSLLPKALQEAGADAVFTPHNHGGWLLLSVGWGTLAVYQLDTDIGGLIPDDLVTRYAVWMLNTLVDKTAKLADRAATHYNAGHKPICAPDGTAIPPY
jgi:hypothetical protein